MTVEETDSVDVISIDKKTGEVVLTVSDHLEWSDNLKHQTVLQAKLNAYLRFVESGEILQRYPKAKDRRVVFRVVFKFAPDLAGRGRTPFVRMAQQITEIATILMWRRSSD